MLKEVKYLIFLIIILFFFFFIGKYYISDANKKKSYRSKNNIDQKIKIFSKNLPILENDTFDIIEYVERNNKKKKKFFFWELIDKDD